MYVSPWLQTALLPERWDVCGVKCPPLSVLAHYMLRQRKNGYLTGAVVDKDAATEVLVYATASPARLRQVYWQPLYRQHVRRAITAKLKRYSWDAIDNAVSEYISACVRVPGHRYVTSSTRKDAIKTEAVSAPLEWVLVEYLSGGNPDNVPAAWSCQFSLALCLFDAGRNARGEDPTLITEQDEQRIDDRLLAEEERVKCQQ